MSSGSAIKALSFNLCGQFNADLCTQLNVILNPLELLINGSSLFVVARANQESAIHVCRRLTKGCYSLLLFNIVCVVADLEYGYFTRRNQIQLFLGRCD